MACAYAAPGYTAAGQIQMGSDTTISLKSGRAYLYNNQWECVEVPSGLQEMYYNGNSDNGGR